MTPSAYGDLVACLPQGKTVFRYGDGQFAPMLLRQFLRRGWTARDLRASKHARLLDHDLVKPILAAKGRLELSENDLLLALPMETKAFRLSVAQWSSNGDRKANQLSRKGCNLVLQLNFANDHDRRFDDLFGSGNNWLLRSENHPMSKTGNTLCWARLDIDLTGGVALTEEIQSDWVRNAASFARSAKWRWRRLQQSGKPIKGVCSPDQLKARAQTYFTEVLPAFASNWQEKMMAACQFFAFEELALDTIYMHTFEAGNHIKGIDTAWRAPPRSIYTDLPRQTGFAKRIGGPEFLAPQLNAPKLRKQGGMRLPFWNLSLTPEHASRA